MRGYILGCAVIDMESGFQGIGFKGQLFASGL